MNNNKIKMMSVNDMQSVYGGEAAVDGGTLPEVTVTASKDRFYKHLTDLMLTGHEGRQCIFILDHYSTKANNIYD
jgi:hypothetical protein